MAVIIACSSCLSKKAGEKRKPCAATEMVGALRTEILQPRTLFRRDLTRQPWHVNLMFDLFHFSCDILLL